MKVISKENSYIKVGDMKKIISDLPDDLEIYIVKIPPIIGNIAQIDNAKLTKYSMFGVLEDCLLLDCIGEPANRKPQTYDIELFEGKYFGEDE